MKLFASDQHCQLIADTQLRWFDIRPSEVRSQNSFEKHLEAEVERKSLGSKTMRLVCRLGVD